MYIYYMATISNNIILYSSANGTIHTLIIRIFRMTHVDFNLIVVCAFVSWCSFIHIVTVDTWHEDSGYSHFSSEIHSLAHRLSHLSHSLIYPITTHTIAYTHIKYNVVLCVCLWAMDLDWAEWAKWNGERKMDEVVMAKFFIKIETLNYVKGNKNIEWKFRWRGDSGYTR